MCVRYDELLEIFLVWSKHRKMEVEIPASRVPATSKFPGSPGRIVQGSFEVVDAQWGLTPFWAPDASFGKKNGYNARAETAFEKPAFREAIRKRRCIVPAGAFYERAAGRWLRFHPGTDRPLPLAAIYEPPNRHCDLLSFALVTTEPSRMVSEFHDRMPVVLAREDMGLWLDGRTPEGDLRALLTPFEDAGLTYEDAGPISTKPESQDGVLPF